MLGRIIVALIVIILILLFALCYNNNPPPKKNMSDEEYEKVMDKYYCSHNATRNSLLLALAVTLTVGLVRTLRATSTYTGGKNMIVEDMEEDEISVFN